MTQSKRRVACSALILAACSGTSTGEHPGGAVEPMVQLTLGTQTGGTRAVGDEGADIGVYCGAPEIWDETDETPPHLGVYTGAVQLRGWTIECGAACVEAQCSVDRFKCIADCGANPAPAGNVRSARIDVTASGPVERIIGADEDEEADADCDVRRRLEVEWRIEIEDVLVARGTGRLTYDADDPYSAWKPPEALEIEELNPSFEMATLDDFDALGAGPSTASTRSVHVDGELTFAEGSVLALLSWNCDGCTWYPPLELARGVLNAEGASAAVSEATPTELPDWVEWSWPDATCERLPEQGGAAGAHNFVRQWGGGGGTAGVDPSGASGFAGDYQPSGASGSAGSYEEQGVSGAAGEQNHSWPGGAGGAPGDGESEPRIDPSGPLCGGGLDVACGEGYFCKYPIEAECGLADTYGACERVLGSCLDYYSAVCGCDGETYGNECEADGSGVSVAFHGECGTLD